LAKYGTKQGRYDGLADEDKQYIRATGALSPRLMQMFHYPQVPDPNVESIVAKSERNGGPCRGKEKLLDILVRAGVDRVSESDCDLLPTWDEVTNLYGKEPIIHGLETCETYRQQLRQRQQSSTGDAYYYHPAPKVAGMFNTGTNAFEESLDLNFEHVDDLLDYILRGGKHVLLRNRKWAANADGVSVVGADTSSPSSEKNVTDQPFFPVVLIRDPFRWMASMVRTDSTGIHSYCSDRHRT